MSRICAFSTANDPYIPSAAASLLSIRRWNKDIPLYIISSRISHRSKKLLRAHDINFIEVDLRKIFTKTWDYPVECYYLFAGPQLLLKEGFSHSLYIDGDVYCNADPLADQPLSSIKAFAGVTHGTIRQILGDDYQKAAQLWPQPSAPKNRLQTGVLYFNNTFLESFNLLEKVGKLFTQALESDIPRKGDDSLFALFQHVYPKLNYKQLPRTFNYITSDTGQSPQELLTRNSNLVHEAVFYHFTNYSKPWALQGTYPDSTYKYFVRQWRLRLIDTFSDKDLKKFFPHIHALLQDSHLRFYSWPSNNVGDLMTPYYLQHVCRVNNLADYSISEDEIMAIEAATPHPEKARYGVSTGSVIRLCGNNALVYGSGIRSADQEVHNSFVRSVRGPLTRGRFLAEGFECPPIYGDPGLLLPLFYRPKKQRKKYKIGIIPHFTEYAQVSELYAGEKDVLVIDMGCGDIEKMIDQMVSCQSTVSSSLHGLVYSHAYGVPTRRIEFSDNVFGDGTKYSDYYQGVNLKPLASINASGFQKISASKLASLKKETLQDFDTQRLLDAMFFNEDGMRPSARYPY
jgi:lipopolysaccharide biosynthesis glycosyltransferase